ncbi:HxlR family transcriptional regulator [Breznakibacter xylanolyticus]|uniref:HxlR family transcriptional regulator n=1 Tax=Breznakibacter xylanolyticus TaxID=990 RepID=A0A2W7MVT9_9BACT|nr:HxlR family transcriptional regulator [Breznakibacter xylanolyticus]
MRNRLPFGNHENSSHPNVTIVSKLNYKTKCPVTATLQLIGGRWKTIILYTLTHGTKRFGEIAVRIPEISRKVLTEQLKELESDGLIVREQFKEIPPRVEYSLTDLGKSLSPVIGELEKWGIENVLAD